MSKIVYFPSMNPPNNDWLKTSLLFYDKIGIIAPGNFINNGNMTKDSEEEFEKHTKFLKDNNQLELVESFYSDDINEKFDNEINLMFEKIETNIDQFKQELSSGNTAGFYYGKLTGRMIQRFQDLKLINTENIPNQYRPHSFYIPKSIGQAIMYSIAKKIGESDGYIPSTDKKKYSYQIRQTINPLITKQNFEEIVLKKVFPVPSNIELEQLLKFKSYYSKELLNYREFLDSFIEQLGFVKKRDIPKYLTSKHNEINKEVDRLLELYKDEGLNQVTLRDLVNAGKFLSGPFGFIGSAINGAYNLIRRNRIPEKGNPLSYAALYNYKFVNKNEDNS